MKENTNFYQFKCKAQETSTQEYLSPILFSVSNGFSFVCKTLELDERF